MGDSPNVFFRTVTEPRVFLSGIPRAAKACEYITPSGTWQLVNEGDSWYLSNRFGVLSPEGGELAVHNRPRADGDRFQAIFNPDNGSTSLLTWAEKKFVTHIGGTFLLSDSRSANSDFWPAMTPGAEVTVKHAGKNLTPMKGRVHCYDGCQFRIISDKNNEYCFNEDHTLGTGNNRDANSLFRLALGDKGYLLVSPANNNVIFNSITDDTLLFKVGDGNSDAEGHALIQTDGASPDISGISMDCMAPMGQEQSPVVVFFRTGEDRYISATNTGTLIETDKSAFSECWRVRSVRHIEATGDINDDDCTYYVLIYNEALGRYLVPVDGQPRVAATTPTKECLWEARANLATGKFNFWYSGGGTEPAQPFWVKGNEARMGEEGPGICAVVAPGQVTNWANGWNGWWMEWQKDHTIRSNTASHSKGKLPTTANVIIQGHGKDKFTLNDDYDCWSREGVYGLRCLGGSEQAVEGTHIKSYDEAEWFTIMFSTAHKAHNIILFSVSQQLPVCYWEKADTGLTCTQFEEQYYWNAVTSGHLELYPFDFWMNPDKDLIKVHFLSKPENQWLSAPSYHLGLTEGMNASTWWLKKVWIQEDMSCTRGKWALLNTASKGYLLPGDAGDVRCEPASIDIDDLWEIVKTPESPFVALKSCNPDCKGYLRVDHEDVTLVDSIDDHCSFKLMLEVNQTVGIKNKGTGLYLTAAKKNDLNADGGSIGKAETWVVKGKDKRNGLQGSRGFLQAFQGNGTWLPCGGQLGPWEGLWFSAGSPGSHTFSIVSAEFGEYLNCMNEKSVVGDKSTQLGDTAEYVIEPKK